MLPSPIASWLLCYPPPHTTSTQIGQRVALTMYRDHKVIHSGWYHWSIHKTTWPHPFSVLQCCSIPGSRAWGKQVAHLEAAQKAKHQGSDPTGFTLSKTRFVLQIITLEIRGAIAIGKAHLNISKRRENQAPFISWRPGLWTLYLSLKLKQ